MSDSLPSVPEASELISPDIKKLAAAFRASPDERQQAHIATKFGGVPGVAVSASSTQADPVTIQVPSSAGRSEVPNTAFKVTAGHTRFVIHPKATDTAISIDPEWNNNGTHTIVLGDAALAAGVSVTPGEKTTDIQFASGNLLQISQEQAGEIKLAIASEGASSGRSTAAPLVIWKDGELLAGKEHIEAYSKAYIQESRRIASDLPRVDRVPTWISSVPRCGFWQDFVQWRADHNGFESNVEEAGSQRKHRCCGFKPA